MIECRNLAFSYPHRPPVLRDVSFSFEKGSCVCLLGPNGTGKTTLLKCMLGHLRPKSGALLLDGKPLQSFSARERAKRIAYVAQSTQLSFPYTVEEVVLMGRTAHIRLGASVSARDRAIAGEILEKLGLSHMADYNFQRLSGGERQLVLFGRALAQQADYLVLDEPTAALDYSNQIKILQTIRNLSQEGYGILMTTHFPDHAFLSCDKAVLMRDGGILAAGDPQTVVTSETLTELYRVPVCVTDAALSYKGSEMIQEVCVPILFNREEKKNDTQQQTR